MAIVDSGATDGFVISPAFVPDTFDDFVDQVVPILQARKWVRTTYIGEFAARASRHVQIPVLTPTRSRPPPEQSAYRTTARACSLSCLWAAASS